MFPSVPLSPGPFMQLMPRAFLSVVPESQRSVRLHVFNKAVKLSKVNFVGLFQSLSNLFKFTGTQPNFTRTLTGTLLHF